MTEDRVATTSPDDVKRLVVMLAKQGLSANKIFKRVRVEFPDVGMFQLTRWVDELTD